LNNRNNSESPGRRPRPAQSHTGYDRYRVVVDILIIIMGAAIVARGFIEHDTPLYMVSGTLFALLGLWRLKLWADGRRRLRP
jgi:hypothetical protein